MTVYVHYSGSVRAPTRVRGVKRKRPGSSEKSTTSDNNRSPSSVREATKTDPILQSAYSATGDVDARIFEPDTWKIWKQEFGVSEAALRASIPKYPQGNVKQTRVVSLHRLAVEVLGAFGRLQEPSEVLECSSRMLRTIHSLALSLSGVLRRGLGLKLHELEESAAGKIYMEETDEGEWVSIYEHPRKSKDGESPWEKNVNLAATEFYDYMFITDYEEYVYENLRLAKASNLLVEPGSTEGEEGREAVEKGNVGKISMDFMRS